MNAWISWVSELKSEIKCPPTRPSLNLMQISTQSAKQNQSGLPFAL